MKSCPGVATASDALVRGISCACSLTAAASLFWDWWSTEPVSCVCVVKPPPPTTTTTSVAGVIVAGDSTGALFILRLVDVVRMAEARRLEVRCGVGSSTSTRFVAVWKAPTSALGCRILCVWGGGCAPTPAFFTPNTWARRRRALG
jgi:hypothetical protein